MLRWLSAFLLTQLIEVPIYSYALRPRRARVAIAFGASAITHPIAWFLLHRVWERTYLALIAVSQVFVIPSPSARYASFVVFAESIVVLIEAGYLRAFGLRRALAWSALANVASVTVGLASRAAFGWP